MGIRTFRATALAITSISCGSISQEGLALPPPDDHGVIHMKAFDLPESLLLSPETRAVFAKEREKAHKEVDALTASYRKCGDLDKAGSAAQAAAIRNCTTNISLNNPDFRKWIKESSIAISSQKIGGVRTDTYVPERGVSPQNRHRVLINVHGGGFIYGGTEARYSESIPISAQGRIKVISVDYRMAPEYKFPAATDDVMAVYKELLRQYKPGEIGIYGCSAGGLLTAEVTARIIETKQPKPGAIAMLCAGAAEWGMGDTDWLECNCKPADVRQDPYFKDVAVRDAEAFPLYSRETMAQFPASLLISGVRDRALSGVVSTHSNLVSLGVPAELHVWEGMEHGFFGDPDLPESKEAYKVIADFFETHLRK